MFKKFKTYLSNSLLTLSFRITPPVTQPLLPDFDAIPQAHRTFEWIRTEEQWAKLGAFAATFDHKIQTRRWPTVIFLNKGKPYGYAYVSRDPMVFTAWHTDPAICSRRDVVETFAGLSMWAKFEHGGAFTTAPEDSESFTPEIMKKLGFGDTKCHLWEIRNN